MAENTFRYIVLTGSPGIGKTTLIKKISHSLQEKNFIVNGFFTEEIRSGGERIGFDVVLLSGERAPLARVRGEDFSKYKIGKYSVDVSSFEKCVLPILSLQSDNSILVLDEIGKMELLSKRFEELVNKLINKGERVILATVPVKGFKPIKIVEAIKSHPLTLMFNVDKQNRNSLGSTILENIVKAKNAKYVRHATS